MATTNAALSGRLIELLGLTEPPVAVCFDSGPSDRSDGVSAPEGPARLLFLGTRPAPPTGHRRHRPCELQCRQLHARLAPAGGRGSGRRPRGVGGKRLGADGRRSRRHAHRETAVCDRPAGVHWSCGREPRVHGEPGPHGPAGGGDDLRCSRNRTGGSRAAAGGLDDVGPARTRVRHRGPRASCRAGLMVDAERVPGAVGRGQFLRNSRTVGTNWWWYWNIPPCPEPG